MTATYSDMIDAMVVAGRNGTTVDKIVLTSDSMETFLTDDNFTEETEERQKEEIGTGWELPIESGDDNYLLLENGSRIALE